MPEHSIQDDPLPYAFQQPDLPRLRLCLPFGASGTCACDRYPFYRALSIMSYNRMWRSREESNLQSLTGYPLSKRGDYHYHTAAYGSGGRNRTTLSRVRTWRPTNGLRRCMGPGEEVNLGYPGKKEKNETAARRSWRQGRASNPQAAFRRLPVFGTGWHNLLPSLP